VKLFVEAAHVAHVDEVEERVAHVAVVLRSQRRTLKSIGR
jgi:hypothetical protein